MKAIKIKSVLKVSLIIVLCLGIAVPSVDARFGSGNQNRNRYQHQYQYENLSGQDVQTMIQMLTKLRAILMELQRLQNRNDPYSDHDFQIVTLSATDVETDEAVLRGRVSEFGDSDYADVWFEYDTDRSDLDNETSVVRIEYDEDEDFEKRIINLDEDTIYYFRAIGEDDEGDRDYGIIARFRTDEEDTQSELPDVTTSSASSTQSDSTVLRGTVDMNDFDNGDVFFVYGEDESQVEDVEDDFDTYADVDEDGADLQKVLVDGDLDGQESYSEEVDGLNSATEHYFSICVGYEDGSDDVIDCGSVRTFTTD